MAVDQTLEQLDVLVHRLPVGVGTLFLLVGHLEISFFYNGGKVARTCVFGVVQDALHPGLIPLPAAWEVLHQLGGEVGGDLAEGLPTEVSREHRPDSLALLGVNHQDAVLVIVSEWNAAISH